MRLGLGLGLGNNRGGGGGAAPNPAPTDIAWAGSHTVAEDAALGAVVGGALSYVDPNDTVTFSLVSDASGLFGVSGTSIIVTGVLDFETAASHNITVRATDSDGGVYDEVFAVTVTDVSETPPENPLPDDGDIIVEDVPTFTNPPIVTNVDGAVKIHGKKASGTLGKFLYNLGAPAANTIYTMHYDPDFTLLTDTGRLALVGFAFKQGNDFHMVGGKGNGASGLHAYQVSGSNKWQSGVGLTEDDAGAVAHGTQAGPNWIQLEIAADGSTYTFRTSADGETWTDEYTDEVPSPFTDATDSTQFGPAAMFWPTDTGSFSIAIEAWIDESAAPQFSWNSADKTAGLTLSQNDLTLEHFAGATEGARGPIALTGKQIFAIHNDTTGWDAGLAKLSHNLDTTSLQSATTAVGYRWSNGIVGFNSGVIQVYAAVAQGEIGLCAFDATAGDVWFGKVAVNGTVTWNGDPGAGTGAAKADLDAGPWYPAVTTGSGRCTIVAVPVAAIPSGFTAYDPTDENDIYVASYWRQLTASDSDGWNGNNVRQQVPAANLSRGGSTIRVTLQAGDAQQATFSHATFMEQAGAGDAWDGTGAVGELLFSGVASGTAAAAGRITTDGLTFTLDETKAYIVGMYFGAGTGADNIKSLADGSFGAYFKAGADDISTANVAGYSSMGNVRGVVGVEVLYAAAA